MGMNDLWDLNSQKWAYQCEYLEQFRLMEEQLGKEIDAIVAPVAATAAVRHGQFKYYGYTGVVNVLDFTSVVVPVMFADKSIDVKDDTYTPLNDMDKAVQAEDDAEVYDGALAAVQVIGRRLTEERIMAIAEEIGRSLGNKVMP